MSEESDKAIHVYPTNPVLQRFDKVKIVQTNFSQDIQDESEHFGENIYQKHLTIKSWNGSQLNIQAKETFNKLTQQLNRESNLYKKDLQKHLEKKEKVNLIFKNLSSLSLEDERIVV